jgi:hypothetical protein
MNYVVKNNIALICLLLISNAAFAEKWVAVVDDGAVRIGVDIESVVTLKSGERKAWVEYVYPSPQPLSEGKTFERFIASTLHKCDERSTAWSRIISFDKASAGSEVDDINLSDNLKYKDIVPGSVAEIAFNYVCNFNLKKK